jgi:hypothetical protein
MTFGNSALLFLVFLTVNDAAWAKKPKPGAEPGAAPGETSTMQIQGTLGELDAGQVERLLQEQRGAMRRCYDETAANLHYLGGRIELKVQVAPSGQPKAVTVTESSLGSFEVERCLAGVLGKLKFPQPKGGDGEVSYPFEAAARTPVGSWPGTRIASVVGKKRGAMKGCPGFGRAAGLRATLYVGPGGKATSAGFSAETPLDDKLARCVAKQLLAAQYDDPLGQMVKVSFDFKDLP